MKKNRFMLAILASSIISLTGCGGGGNSDSTSLVKDNDETQNTEINGNQTEGESEVDQNVNVGNGESTPEGSGSDNGALTGNTDNSGGNGSLPDVETGMKPEVSQPDVNQNLGQTTESNLTSLQKQMMVKVFDVNNILLKNVSVKILKNTVDSANEGLKKYFVDSSSLPEASAFNYQTEWIADQSGKIEIEPLVAGQYFALIKMNQKTVITAISIASNDYLEGISLHPNVSCTDLSCSDVDGINALIGQFTGKVVSDNLPVANAQVSLAAGPKTNGAYVTAITDANGYFSLPINVATKLASVVENSTLKILAAGYETQELVVNVNASGSYANTFNLCKAYTASPTVLWHENFEADSKTRDSWLTYSTNAQVSWNRLEGPYSIINNAAGLLSFVATNDLSQGNISAPLEGNTSYWFGDAVTGNYGSAATKSSFGELESPSIDLSQYSKPLSLSFKTWWEIESINPNQKGFDIMDVLISKDGGKTYFVLTRLNPLSDPQSSLALDHVPYTNAGYYLAPILTQQEPISLDEYVGQKDVRIKFRFNSVDQHYNYFRGWMLDDIKIEQTAGTFPLFEEHLNIQTNNSVFSAVSLAKSVLQVTLGDERWDSVPSR